MGKEKYGYNLETHSVFFTFSLLNAIFGHLYVHILYQIKLAFVAIRTHFLFLHCSEDSVNWRHLLTSADLASLASEALRRPEMTSMKL